MSEIRVLIIDDSVATRRWLSEALEREPGITVTGAAPNGLLGLDLLPRARPDVVILDLDMPVMDGLAFLRRMRPGHPRLPVLVFSAASSPGSEATLEALWLGASDHLLKPRLADGPVTEFVRDELVPRLRALAHAPRYNAPSHASRTTAPAAPAPLRGMLATEAPASLVVVGASTGGPRALTEVLGMLPRDLGVPVVVVQHLPAEMTDFFAAGLENNCLMPVRIAEDRRWVEPGFIWLAPGGAHLTFTGDGPRARFRHDRGPAENGCRPSVDPLFRSATNVHGSGTLGVVLTGMGRDGLLGCRAIHDAHGRVLVQDEATSVVWGMPGAVARAGLAHAVLPVDRIGPEILARVRCARDHAA